MGSISGEFSNIPVTRKRYRDNEQRTATHSLRRKMARSQAEPDLAYHRKAETIPRATGVFFYRVLRGVNNLCSALIKAAGSNGFETRGALRNRSGRLGAPYPVTNMKGTPCADNSSASGYTISPLRLLSRTAKSIGSRCAASVARARSLKGPTIL
jgi:hypothetical protein